MKRMTVRKTHPQGKAEFMGRAVTQPSVKLLNEPYARPDFPPSLQWIPLWRDEEDAGEILAAFELLEVTYTNPPEILHI